MYLFQLRLSVRELGLEFELPETLRLIRFLRELSMTVLNSPGCRDGEGRVRVVWRHEAAQAGQETYLHPGRTLCKTRERVSKLERRHLAVLDFYLKDSGAQRRDEHRFSQPQPELSRPGSH